MRGLVAGLGFVFGARLRPVFGVVVLVGALLGVLPGGSVGALVGPDAVFYVSSTTAGSVGGVAFQDEDVLAFDSGSGAWSLAFDGSDVGLAATDVDAFSLVSLDPFVAELSFRDAETVPGLGAVDDSDVVTFSGVGGASTSGVFSLAFDGSDVSLTTFREDVDAWSVFGVDRVLSTTGDFVTSGVSGDRSDGVVFVPSSLGANTAGVFSVGFDGSDVGVTQNLSGVSVSAGSVELFGSFAAAWSVGGESGDANDVFEFSEATGSVAVVFDGDAHGFGSEVIDAVHVEAGSVSGSVADLSVADVSVDPVVATAGGQVSVTVEVANAGPDQSDGVSVDVGLPAGLSFVSSSGCGNDPSGVVCALGSISPGGTAQFSVVADVASGADGQSLSVTATVSGSGVDPNPGNDIGSVVVSVGASPSAVDDTFTIGIDEPLSVDAAGGLLVNDGLGDPAGSVISFGGGLLGGDAGDNAAGSSATVTEGTVTVDADGGVEFSPAAGFEGTFVFRYRLANPIGESEAAVSIVVGDQPTVESTTIYVSSTTSGNAGGVGFQDEDVIAYDTATGVWSMTFDGSDVGLAPTDVDGFSLVSLDPFHAYLSFRAPATIAGVGQVDDSDVVSFIGTAGPDTVGVFDLVFDASSAGFTTFNEDIDAIHHQTDGLVVSTTGGFNVPISGGLIGADEEATELALTAGTATAASVAFDGSDVGFAGSDLQGLSIDPSTGGLFGAGLGNWTIAGTAGDGDDVFAFTGTTGPNTAGNATVILDGDSNGLGNEQIDALHVSQAVQTPPENTAPTITDPGAPSVPENTTFVVDVQATDDLDSEGSGLTFSLTGGADQGLFSIDASSGVVAFDEAPDFEAPGDADTNLSLIHI